MSDVATDPRLQNAHGAPRRRLRLSWSDSTSRAIILIVGMFDLLMMGKVALGDPSWESFNNEIYIVIAAIYIAFCFAMSKYSHGLERDLARAQRR